MEFHDLLLKHHQKYPLMDIFDDIKLAYQCAYGPYHMNKDKQAIVDNLKKEECNDIERVEYLTNNYARFYFDHHTNLDTLSDLFLLSMQHTTTNDLFFNYLDVIVELFGNKNIINDYLAGGIKPISHSDVYKKNYHPHYRLLNKDYANYFKLIDKIKNISKDKNRITIAIDGMCASGKSELANILASVFELEIIHLDDFYLPKKERGVDWFDTIAGNMNIAYFKKHVLNENIEYQPFSCSSQSYLPSVKIDNYKILLIEGTYSMLPELQKYYDLKVFLKCSPEKQIQRLKKRENFNIDNFVNTWLVKEQKYFNECQIDKDSDIVINTDDYF